MVGREGLVGGEPDACFVVAYGIFSTVVPRTSTTYRTQCSGVDCIFSTKFLAYKPSSFHGFFVCSFSLFTELLSVRMISWQPSSGLVKKAIQFKRKLREYVDDVRVQTFLHARPK